jgi:hypothetical protein
LIAFKLDLVVVVRTLGLTLHRADDDQTKEEQGASHHHDEREEALLMTGHVLPAARLS